MLHFMCKHSFRSGVLGSLVGSTYVDFFEARSSARATIGQTPITAPPKAGSIANMLQISISTSMVFGYGIRDPRIQML